MRAASKLLQDPAELFCHGSCQRMLPRQRFYASNPSRCMACWGAQQKARRIARTEQAHLLDQAQRRARWAAREERRGRTPKRRAETLMRLLDGMTRCTLPRPRGHREVALAGTVQCAGLCLSNERIEHLRDIHGLVDLSADEISACFVAVEHVADRLNADDLR